MFNYFFMFLCVCENFGYFPVYSIPFRKAVSMLNVRQIKKILLLLKDFRKLTTIL